jgi:hypothetical protein
MDETQFNSSIRKFLKETGVTAQREIEKAVREAIRSGKLRGDETLGATMTLELGAIKLTHAVEGEIVLGAGPSSGGG